MGKRRRNNHGQDDDNGFGAWGGYMEAKKTKLIEQFNNQADKVIEKKSDLFKGIAIFVNGYTKPNAEELKVLMAEHGGVFHTYQNSSTKFIIASNLPNVKINKLGAVPIIKPGWITDSITLGRIVDYSSYLLYSNQSKTQPRLNYYLSKNETKVSDETLQDIVQNKEVKVALSTNVSTKTASDPKFLSEFYSNSRLHLIATLGAEYKQLVNEMREKTNWKFPGLNALKLNKIERPLYNNSKRVIMHIDMDCFFVSVGLKTRPELRGKPVAVTHSKGGTAKRNTSRQTEIDMYKDRLPDGAISRLDSIDDNSSLSEIASCSYEARRCGIKNGMFMGAALKLCPDLKPIPYDFEGYKDVSHILYETISNYTLDIEAVSCDEMYVDVSYVLSETGFDVEQWATHVREEIKLKTGCPCSTGFGSNRLQARLATKRAKPDGQFYLKPEQVEDYMTEIHLSDLPGVGRATLWKLKGIGLETCGDVQNSSLHILQKELGMKVGETIWEQSSGSDRKPLNYEHERKSVSAEVNYGIRFRTNEESLEFLERLSEEVKTRLTDTGLKAKCVTLKLMIRAQDAPTETAKFLGHGVCDSLSRSTTLNHATEDAKIIFKEVKILYEKLNINFTDLRGVGIQLSRLEKAAAMNALLKNFLNSKSKTSDSIVKNETSLGIKQLNEVIKSRGRPKGSKSGVKVVEPNNVSDFFKVQKELPVFEKCQFKKDIDFDVLKELPADIRNEVMKEYNLDERKSPEKIKKEPPVTKKSNEASFNNLTYDDFKVMLMNWIKSQAKPLNCDISMLGNHFKQLAVQRKIEDLHVLLKFLHRNLETQDCNWHEAYFTILNFAQEGMLLTYGSVLHAESEYISHQSKISS